MMLKRYKVTVLNFLPAPAVVGLSRPALAQEAVVAVFADSDDQAKQLGVAAFKNRQPFAIDGEEYAVTGIEEVGEWTP